jgi:hypothetical protein
VQNGIIHSILITGTVLLLPAALLGQSARQPVASSAVPDFSGVWTRKAIPPPSDLPKPGPNSERGAGNPDQFGFTPEAPSMTPWGKERYEMARVGRHDPYEMKAEQPDPELYPYCLPGGFPRDYTEPFPFRVVQTPDILIMIFEWQQGVRQIYLDGRKPVAGAPATFMGDSTGHWEGDTLVVETVNIDEPGWIDNVGHPRSDRLRVVERIRRLDHDTLQVDLTFDDPKAYTKPWSGRKLFRLLPTDTYVGEVITCEDHLKDTYSEDLTKGKMQGRP